MKIAWLAKLLGSEKSAEIIGRLLIVTAVTAILLGGMALLAAYGVLDLLVWWD